MTATTEQQTQLVPPNILLNGDAGVGKTHSLATLVEWCEKHSMSVFYLDIDNSLETLLGYWRDKNLPIPSCLKWHHIPIAPIGLDKLIEGAKDTSELTYEMLTKKTDSNRRNAAYWQILSALANFKDQRTGKEFGGLDKLGPDNMFILDSFTALSDAAAKMVVGVRPTMAPPDYGTAQNHLMNFLRLATKGMQAGFIMTCHPTRDENKLTGQTVTTIRTIGTAIQAEIPPLFSEVLYAVREGDKFYWDTAAYGVIAKTRSLGYRSRIEQDFALIMDKWKQRAGK